MKIQTSLSYDLNRKLKGSNFFARKIRTGKFSTAIAIYVKWGWFDFCSTELGIYKLGKVVWNMDLKNPKMTKVGKDYIVIDSIYREYANKLEQLLDCEVTIVYDY